MSKTEKSFDAVAMMRAARDRISAEIEGMTLEEELRWLTSQDLKTRSWSASETVPFRRATDGSRSADGGRLSKKGGLTSSCSAAPSSPRPSVCLSSLIFSM